MKKVIVEVSLYVPDNTTKKAVAAWVGDTLRDAGQEMEPLYHTAKKIKVRKVDLE